ncbi:RNA-binding, RBD [Diplocarpon rosae]|nr:RNA-binding, RBD [Diplocarpon rosae]
MDIHIRNVPQQSTENHLSKFLRPFMLQLSIRSVNCTKPRNRDFAFLTFLHPDEAEKFLQHYGQAQGTGNRQQTGSRQLQTQTQPQSHVRRNITAVNLKFLGRSIYCQKSTNPSNPYLLRVLAKEEKDRQRKITTVATVQHHVLPIFFDVTSVSCGVWNYAKSTLFYEPQVLWRATGRVKFGEHSTILYLESGRRIDFLYFSTLNITTEEGGTPSLLFSMKEAPRFYEKIVDNPLADLMSTLGIQTPQGPQPKRKTGPERHRLPCLGPTHEPIAGSCFVYRIAIRPGQSGQGDVAERMQSLRIARGLPRVIHRRTDVAIPRETFADGLLKLQTTLALDPAKYPFPLAFQILKLAQDAYLPPRTVYGLLPAIAEMTLRSPISICVRVIRKMFNQIDFPGPESEATEFQLEELLPWLETLEDQCHKEALAVEKDINGSENVAIIHRVKITPAAIRLCGPDSESNNRVLRKYPKHHEYFIRVQFSDEDGQQVRFNSQVSNEKIFHERFKNILRDGIQIAGREYAFLGSSHSSLRSQSCWFMAPFIHNGSLLWDRIIIKELGNFTSIRSPAKCAARIGQVFSDTRIAVSIDPSSVLLGEDVERNGRVFSDGVGTISAEMMSKIWDKLPSKKLVEPSLLQIRYQGAKGMVSIDTRLRGELLLLRRSMIKFDGSTWPDVEICEAAYKPLTMFLNRQFIKILEDLGVDDKFFLNLQAEEVQHLRSITDSPINASSFLKRQSIGIPAHLPWFIGKLTDLGLDFRRDGFLRDILEMTLLVELRLLKHKTRIPVAKGWHLHGIMDETGFLEEGQIFCSAIVDGVSMAIAKDNIVISRAPALHPGDVQIVDGVIPPTESPLRELSNCIVFSSKGARDLPSQLSGGDLDGDRYYVIWDDDCCPRCLCKAADYARQTPIDIGRAVTRNDMTDFFIQFMETDQLGRIAVLHRVLADQHLEGTFHDDCIALAGMHSTAVDFSKTGIPASHAASADKLYNNWRPDFEAPGPHVKVEKMEGLSLEEMDDRDPDDRGDDDEDFSRYRYYESEKVLGKLYRDIDERDIFEHIKHRSLHPDISSQSTVINSVWDHVRAECALFQYTHHLEWAKGIHDMYEETMLEIMINHSEHTLSPVSELEAFIGNILGKTGAQSKTQRELSTTMKEKFDEHSAFIVNCIVKEDSEWSEESLERSMACLAVSLEKKTVYKRFDSLLSFKYIAAAVCLREVERLPRF